MNFIDRKMRRFRWWRKWRGLPEPIAVTATMVRDEAMRVMTPVSVFADNVNRDWPND